MKVHVLLANGEGTIHVHREGCADVRRGARIHVYDSVDAEYTDEIASVKEAVELMYGPSAGSFYAEAGIPESEWGEAWRDYRQDVKVFACASSLPEE